MCKLTAPHATALFIFAPLLAAMITWVAMSSAAPAIAASPTDPPAPTLVPADISQMALSDITEVEASDVQPLVRGTQPTINRAAAVKIAEDYVGRRGHPTRAYLATIAEQGASSIQVWVVTFGGATAPPAGPAGRGASARPLDMLAFIVNASTGEIISGYGRIHH